MKNTVRASLTGEVGETLVFVVNEMGIEDPQQREMIFAKVKGIEGRVFNGQSKIDSPTVLHELVSNEVENVIAQTSF